MKTGKQNLSTNLLLLSRNQVVAKTERRALKFVQNGSIDIFVVINPHEIFLRGQKGELLHFRLAEKGWKKFALDEIDQDEHVSKTLVASVRIQIVQIRRNSIMFTQNHGLRDGHVWR